MAGSFSFRLIATDGAARTGEITTAHGVARTPAFMPVGTQGAIKGVHHDDVRAAGADIILANTYHLMLRPSAERVATLGGLHEFMRWPLPILTDSGGYQVMSLAPLRKVSVQILLGADIAMQLDECVRLPAEPADIERGMRLSLRWAERCKHAFEKAPADRALFGIVQGGDDARLREASARALIELKFDGYAIGGLAVGESEEMMLRMVAATAPVLPAERPRYLMGVGTPSDILKTVARGIDMFDCVLPTRNGRHGLAFTRFGAINIKNARHAEDPRPLDPDSRCAAAREFSRAYLHHLFKANEALGGTLLSIVNLYYYQDLIAGAREAIARGRFADYSAEVESQWVAKSDLG